MKTLLKLPHAPTDSRGVRVVVERPKEVPRTVPSQLQLHHCSKSKSRTGMARPVLALGVLKNAAVIVFIAFSFNLLI